MHRFFLIGKPAAKPLKKTVKLKGNNKMDI
jgi:hypothetical protein